MATIRREKRFRQELQVKYEQVLATYNEEIQKRLRLENEISRYRGKRVRTSEVGESSQKLLASSPAPPPPTSSIVHILDTPLHQEDTSKEEMEEDKARLKTL